MITKSKITEIFCIADDFCKEFEVEIRKHALSSTRESPKRHRKRMMSDAEVITILITSIPHESIQGFGSQRSNRTSLQHETKVDTAI